MAKSGLVPSNILFTVFHGLEDRREQNEEVLKSGVEMCWGRCVVCLYEP